MIATRFDARDSEWVADMLRRSLALAVTTESLRDWAGANHVALSLLTEEDRQSVRDAWRAKRDELERLAA